MISVFQDVRRSRRCHSSCAAAWRKIELERAAMITVVELLCDHPGACSTATPMISPVFTFPSSTATELHLFS